MSLILWCKLKKRQNINKWDPRGPLVGLYLKRKLRFYKGKQIESENGFMDGDRGSVDAGEKQTGRDMSVFQVDETNVERRTQLRDDAENRRRELLTKMRSTVGSNGFTEASKHTRRHRQLDDQDDMGMIQPVAFQRNLTKEEIDQLIAENPELEEEFENERQRWLEFGEHDANNINPLSDYNTLLVSKMQKGYDKDANTMVDKFRSKDFKQHLEKIEEERQNEMKELEMDHLEATGKAVVVPAEHNLTGRPVRKKIKRKKKGKKKGKMFILDTPYGKAKYYKRPRSPPSISEDSSGGMMFQNRKNLDKNHRAKADKLHGIDERDELGNSINDSSMVEGNEVFFETGFGPNKEAISDEDEMDEADMVYYNKEDVTNFSKNLGLNKIQSRLSLMNFRKSQEGKTASAFSNELEDDEAQIETGFNEVSPKRKFVQKKTDRKRDKRKTNRKHKKTQSIASLDSYRKRNISIREGISSLGSASRYDDSDGELTSEEDNPNDRSGLLSNYGRSKPKNPQKRKIKRKNKWVEGTQKLNETTNSARKSFRSTNNLSLVLPRYKRKLKRNNIIRKKPAQKPIFSTGSPYEEYLPDRFKEYNNSNDLNMSRNSSRQPQNVLRVSKQERQILEAERNYGTKPPKSNNHINFFKDINQKLRKSKKKLSSPGSNFGKFNGN